MPSRRRSLRACLPLLATGLLSPFVVVAAAPLAAAEEVSALAEAEAEAEAVAAETAEPAAADAAGRPLADHHRRFLEDVALLISDAEREAFLALGHDYQRDAFVRRFWRVRDPHPETPRNELADRWRSRVEVARQRWGSLDGDGARILLLLGEPAESWRFSCSEWLRPLELWRYEGTEAIRSAFYVVFERSGGRDARLSLWYPSSGLGALLDLAAAARSTEPGGERSVLGAVARDCPRGRAVVDALGAALDLGAVEAAGVSLVPRPNDEWVGRFQAASTDLPPDAPELPGELAVSFPGRRGQRTVVQGLVAVPRAAATAAPRDEGSAYAFRIDGEVVREGELFEQFRYRFELPVAEAPPETLPLVLQRALRPGRYRLVVRVEDVAAGAFLRRELDLEVPRVDRSVRAAGVPATPIAPADAAAAAATDLDRRLAEAHAAIDDGDHRVRLLPPPPGLQTGKLRVEALADGPEIARVRFHLDGRAILAKTRAPYSVELDLGEQPRLHRLAAVAEDRGGGELARDEILLNAGPHRFGVRLVEPRRGGRYRDSLSAHAVVDVPQGERLDRVELYLDERRVATLYDPPFTQPILLPPDAGLTFVRAVAYLADGNSAEDLVHVNAPENLEEIDIDFVELYTTVLDRRGRPVDGLGRDDFTVFEDGERQEIRRFERALDQPVHAGVLLDLSTSMDERLPEAVEAAAGFFERVITPRDRAAVITFNERPELVARFTNDVDLLAGSLRGVRAEGETALYDSLIYALYYFNGIRGKRALVLLTDGEDGVSSYRFEDAIEYARRSGVALYAIGVDLPQREIEARSKLMRLADETGGRSFFIQRASELDDVYAAIETELRSQYLLGYQSTAEDPDRFREIEVEVDCPGCEAKTLRGYYP